MKIIFMGTPEFSAEVLKQLHQKYKVAAVVTGLDKPVGRGGQIKYSPLKTLALDLNIPVLQYEKVSKEGIADIEALAPDLIITAAFGQILSERFLNIPKFGVLNVHASLLPKYRGASPIQWAVLNGDSETGITIMKTVKAVDAGDILLQKPLQILDDETSGELFDRLAALGGEAVLEAVGLIESGKAQYVKQDESQATHCGMIEKADGKIDFNRTYLDLHNFVRGMSPWPSAYTQLNGKTLKIYSVKRDDTGVSAIGEVLVANARDGLIVGCKNGAVRLLEIQIEGGKRMTDIEFLRGRSIDEGYKFL